MALTGVSRSGTDNIQRTGVQTSAFVAQKLSLKRIIGTSVYSETKQMNCRFKLNNKYVNHKFTIEILERFLTVD